MAWSTNLLVVGAPVALACVSWSCDGDVDADTSSGTGTGTGTGGAGAAGGGGPDLCGGVECPPNTFCDHPGDTCGRDGTAGVCAPNPTACDEGCVVPVCGCDGQTYCNECIAHMAGAVDVDASGTCMQPTEGGRAFYQPGGLDHLIVTLADPERDVCLRLYADAPMDMLPGYAVTMPRQWAVSNVEATNQAADCLSPFDTPMGDRIYGSGASGAIAWPADEMIPCSLDADAVLLFTAPPAWLAEEEVFQAVGVEVENGCL